jgi:hypothetical protein
VSKTASGPSGVYCASCSFMYLWAASFDCFAATVSGTVSCTWDCGVATTSVAGVAWRYAVSDGSALVR